MMIWKDLEASSRDTIKVHLKKNGHTARIKYFCAIILLLVSASSSPSSPPCSLEASDRCAAILRERMVLFGYDLK
jgi:hypothetical protein